VGTCFATCRNQNNKRNEKTTTSPSSHGKETLHLTKKDMKILQKNRNEKVTKKLLPVHLCGSQAIKQMGCMFHAWKKLNSNNSVVKIKTINGSSAAAWQKKYCW